MNPQFPRALCGGALSGLLENPNPVGIGRRVKIPAPVELKDVAAFARQVFDEVNTAIHKAHHRLVRAGPPVAVALGRFVAGERERRALVHEDDALHAALDGEIVGGGYSGDPRAADHDISNVRHFLTTDGTDFNGCC